MSDDRDLTVPCVETNDQGVRCIREAHLLDGEPVPHDHQFPALLSREQVDITESYGTIVQRVPVGSGHELLVMGDGCIRFAHDCDRHVRFPDRPVLPLRIAPALKFGSQRGTPGSPAHTVVVKQDAVRGTVLHVEPSILCEDCGTHGFVTNGLWRDV